MLVTVTVDIYMYVVVWKRLHYHSRYVRYCVGHGYIVTVDIYVIVWDMVTLLQ